jgi:hypothetical protein
MLGMKKNGGRDGEGKLEARFAALTSGLLARKGQAAPSNAPIQDPAEETDAFALEPKSKPKAKTAPPLDLKTAAKTKAAGPEPQKRAEPPVTAAPKVPSATAAPKAQPVSSAPTKPVPAPKAQPAASAPKTQSATAAPMTVINERSIDAGYPDNPSPEEIAALEAEADEVLSYFEKFGDTETIAQEKSAFYGDRPDEDDDLDSLEDDDDPLDELEGDAPAPQAAAPTPAPQTKEVKAGVTVHLSAREFMRLALGAAEMDISADDLIAEAIEEYLDARGVLSLGGCSCLAAVMKKPGEA